MFRLLDPDAFRACFQTFVHRLAEACEGVIAIDGKSMRRSFDKASDKSPLHMVSAWCAEQRLILGQLATDAKSNEITAIPKGVITSESVFYLLSAPMAVARFADAARGHWGVENSLHWVLDATMNEDQARNRLDNGPENFGILRHIAINILSKDKSKLSKRRKLNKAAWNNAYLLQLLAQI